MLKFIYLLNFFLIINSKNLPPSIKKCSISSPNLGKCMKEALSSIQPVIRDQHKYFNLPSLEPIFIPKMDLGNSSSSSFTLHQIYENVHAYGTTHADIIEIEADFSDNNCHWMIKSILPELKIEAQYTLKGNILLLSINGRGNSTTILYDATTIWTMKCEKYMKKNEEKYLRITDFHIKTTPKQIVYNLENLVDGNEQLSKEVLKTLNDNALEVYQDLGPLFDNAFAIVFKQLINQFFSSFPQKDVFLP